MTVDPTKPNISRVYDYVLGGHHNLEPDRLMAEQMLKIVPSYPVWARLNRWFLQMVALKWNADGQANILDLASGLPTQDHFHELAPQARVVYCDNDPITVTYAHQVIGDNPRTIYHLGDIRDIQSLLAAADAHFRGDRRAAVGLIGITYMVDTPALKQLVQELHAWAAPGSVLAVTFMSNNATPKELTELMKTMVAMGITLYPRPPEELVEILAPWRLKEMRSLVDWLDVEIEIAPDDAVGQSIQVYGALFER
jgi:hypothetical protein